MIHVIETFPTYPLLLTNDPLKTSEIDFVLDTAKRMKKLTTRQDKWFVSFFVLDTAKRMKKLTTRQDKWFVSLHLHLSLARVSVPQTWESVSRPRWKGEVAFFFLLDLPPNQDAKCKHTNLENKGLISTDRGTWPLSGVQYPGLC